METLQKFYNFVSEINRDNSRLYKQAILEKYKDDEDIKYYLDFVYNPYIITGISSKKINKQVGRPVGGIILPQSVKDLCEYLKVNNTGTDVDIFTISSYKNICIHKGELKLFLDKIITKDLQIGIDTKTINKIISGLIPEFNVQLAEKYFENPDKIIGKEFAITTKIDGGRIVAIKENGIVSFYTRQGQLYEGLVDLEKEMRDHMPDNICLDGEITLLDKGKLTSKDQYKQTMKITRTDGEKHGIKMLVFDYMSVKEFRTQNCTRTYKERREILEKLFNNKYMFKYFDLLPILYQGTDTKEIKKWLDINTNKGEEGVMLNIVDAPYQFKRTWDLQKVKKMQDVDLKIIGFEEGTGRNSGKLGAILVDYKGNTVKCGSGFSDELRQEIWDNKDSWLGRTVVIQYFEETKNQKGGTSLRFPIYIDYRTDK